MNRKASLNISKKKNQVLSRSMRYTPGALSQKPEDYTPSNPYQRQRVKSLETDIDIQQEKENKT
jgi:hypothetical protein